MTERRSGEAQPMTPGGLVGAELKVVQLNCNLRAVASSSLAVFMVQHGVGIAMLQEQNVLDGVPTGFSGMRTFSNVRAGSGNKAAIVINAPDVEAVSMEAFTGTHGTSVWTKGPYGTLIVVSMYCKHDASLAPYVQYMDDVLEAAGSTPVLFGIDATARSRMWHSKVQPSANDIRDRAVKNLRLSVLSLPYVVFDYTLCRVCELALVHMAP